MFSIHQIIKALRKLQNVTSDDLVKSLKHAATSHIQNNAEISLLSPPQPAAAAAATTNKINSITLTHDKNQLTSSTSIISENLSRQPQPQQQQEQEQCQRVPLSQQTQVDCQNIFSLIANANASSTSANNLRQQKSEAEHSKEVVYQQQRSQQIQNFYQKHLIHTQHNPNLQTTDQQQQKMAMSSIAANGLAALKQEELLVTTTTTNGSSSSYEYADNTEKQSNGTASRPGKPALNNSGLAGILQFMELIGNLKHTKRTGWVLRDVNDCESISGHMYRMSMMTFLIDGNEDLNQIRCMELALVHDLAESLVGDITPFCGVSKTEKRNMEFKAMADICKLIEPRGKRIMMLFEEYESGESAESKFVKDLDRLDMVMQAFEYEKRDNCLLKHQEFFDSTEGKFNHPFVKKLVDEIYEQRKNLVQAQGTAAHNETENGQLPAEAQQEESSTSAR